jgi:periplasmic protein TonB
MISPRPNFADRMVAPVATDGHFGQAALVVLAHAMLLVLLVQVAVPVPPQAGEPPGFALLFARAPAPTLPVTPYAATTLPQPVVAAAPRLAEISPVTSAAPETVHLARASPHVRHQAVPAPRNSSAAAAPAAVPAAVVAQKPTPATAARQSAPTDDGAALARLRGAISEAVQSVAEMPMAARLQRREGRAQVGFAYQDGTVADATLLQSSRSRLLDQAALTAVMRARYPAPPAPLRGRRLSLQVWVDFTMVPQAPI